MDDAQERLSRLAADALDVLAVAQALHAALLELQSVALDLKCGGSTSEAAAARHAAAQALAFAARRRIVQ